METPRLYACEQEKKSAGLGSPSCERKLLVCQYISKYANCIRDQLTSSLVLRASLFRNTIPMPSITAINTADPIAPFLTDRKPPRVAKAPPVTDAAPIAFQGSSFRRMPVIEQLSKLKSPLQAPTLPPKTGARILMAVSAPIRRSPYGLLRNPLVPCQNVAPIVCQRFVRQNSDDERRRGEER